MAEDGTSATTQKFEFNKDGKATNSRNVCGCVTIYTIVISIIILLLVTALITVAVLLAQARRAGHYSKPADAGKDDDVCLTPECTSAAAKIHSYIDYNTRPCDDFYQFACGGWLKGNEIPDDRYSYSPIDDLKDQISTIIKGLLETNVTYLDQENTKQAKLYYQSCMDASGNIESNKNKQFEELLTSLGGWPLANLGWSLQTFNLTKLISDLTIYGSRHFFKLSVGVDIRNVNRRVIQIGKIHSWLPQNDTSNRQYKLVRDVIKVLNPSADLGTMRPYIDTFLTFQENLRKILASDTDKQDNHSPNYSWMRVDELSALMSKDGTMFIWKQYLEELKITAGISNRDYDQIMNTSPEYFTKLTDLLKKTDTRTLVDYLVWNFVVSFAFFFGEKYEDQLMPEYKFHLGVTSKNARYKVCGFLASSVLGLNIGRLFVKDNFDAETKVTTHSLTEEIRKSFTELLNGVDWMDKDLKLSLKEKSEQMSFKIGYPDKLNSDSYVDKFYPKYTFDHLNFIENEKTVRKETFKKNFRRLETTVDDNDDTFFSPQGVWTEYRPLWNQLVIPAGSLHPPFFNKNYPKYLNFGGLGYYVSIDIIQGFSMSGEYVSKTETLAKIKAQVNIFYNTRTQCFINQFGHLREQENGRKLNRTTDQEDIVVYTAGLKLSNMAYRKWLAKQKKEEQKLPGLKYDPHQLFFINYAQLMCVKQRKQLASILYEAPRVNMAVQNSPEFAKAFLCSEGASMNPKNKCAAW